MSTGFLLLNAAYLVYAASAAFKEILYLRLTLLVATSLYLLYGVVEPNWSVFFWNIPVGGLHLWAIWQLFSARRGIDLDDEAEAVRTLIFPELSRVSFNTLWHCGEERELDGDVIISKGAEVESLVLLLEGEIDVTVSDALTVRLSPYRLLGEMSSLSGEPASATVTAHGAARIRVWSKQVLDTCSRQNPEVEVALLRAMGQEVARKLI